MQTKQIKELKNQASALGRHLRDLHGLDLSHSALLETLAAMHNAPDWNSLQSRPAPAPKKQANDPLADLSASELLAAAMAKGLTSGETLNAFGAAQSPYQKAFARHARENCATEGELEFDDPGCLVSLSSDQGAYVQAWYWVRASDVSLQTNSLKDLMDLGFELVSVWDESGEGDVPHLSVRGMEVADTNGQPVLRVTSTQATAAFEPFEPFDVPKALSAPVEALAFEDCYETEFLQAHPLFLDEVENEFDGEEPKLYQVRFGNRCLRFKRVHHC